MFLVFNCRIVRDFEVVAEGGSDVTSRIGNPAVLNPANILSGPQAAEVVVKTKPDQYLVISDRFGTNFTKNKLVSE